MKNLIIASLAHWDIRELSLALCSGERFLIQSPGTEELCERTMSKHTKIEGTARTPHQKKHERCTLFNMDIYVVKYSGVKERWATTKVSYK